MDKRRWFAYLTIVVQFMACFCFRNTLRLPPIALTSDTRVLDGYQFRSLNTTQVSNCMTYCLLFPICRSISYSQNGVCDLNVISVEDQTASTEFSSGSVYISRINIPTDLVEGCGNNGCDPSSLCISDSQSHQHCIPLFQDKYCSEPTTIRKASISGISPYAVGTTLTYTCDANYDLIGQPAITCMDSMKWSTNTFKCQGGNTVSSIGVSNGGTYGSWRSIILCPAKTYATGYRMKIQAPVGALSDDTSLNAIQLQCESLGESTVPVVLLSDDGGFGTFHDWTYCGAGQYLTAFRLQVQIGHLIDDTGVNFIEFQCRDFNHSNSYTIATPPGYGNWGTFGSWSTPCSLDTAICGMRIKMQSYQGQFADDTTLNDILFYCCN